MLIQFSFTHVHTFVSEYINATFSTSVPTQYFPYWWPMCKQCTVVRSDMQRLHTAALWCVILDFKGFTSYSNLFGIASFAWELVDHARFCIPENGVFGFHQGSSEGGGRFVCHFYVVASEVCMYVCMYLLIGKGQIVQKKTIFGRKQT